MAQIIRQGIKTWFCLGDLQCGQPVPAIFINELNSNMKAVANTGTLACGLSNGYTHGRVRAFHGWGFGKNILRSNSSTRQMVELSDTYDSFVLEFEGKLGNLGGGAGMQQCEFWLFDPVTAHHQKLGSIQIGASTLPVEFQVQYETTTRVRVYGSLDATILGMIPAGKTISLDFMTLMQCNGVNGSTHNVTGSYYWSGILSAEFKFFRSCP